MQEEEETGPGGADWQAWPRLGGRPQAPGFSGRRGIAGCCALIRGQVGILLGNPRFNTALEVRHSPEELPGLHFRRDGGMIVLDHVPLPPAGIEVPGELLHIGAHCEWERLARATVVGNGAYAVPGTRDRHLRQLQRRIVGGRVPPIIGELRHRCVGEVAGDDGPQLVEFASARCVPLHAVFGQQLGPGQRHFRGGLALGNPGRYERNGARNLASWQTPPASGASRSRPGREQFLGPPQGRREVPQGDVSNHQDIDIARCDVAAAGHGSVDEGPADLRSEPLEDLADDIRQPRRLREEAPEVSKQQGCRVRREVHAIPLLPALEQAGRDEGLELPLERGRSDPEVTGKLTQVPAAGGVKKGGREDLLADPWKERVEGAEWAHSA
jgi:hypothetical protein